MADREVIGAKLPDKARNHSKSHVSRREAYYKDVLIWKRFSNGWWFERDQKGYGYALHSIYGGLSFLLIIITILLNTVIDEMQ